MAVFNYKGQPTKQASGMGTQVAGSGSAGAFGTGGFGGSSGLQQPNQNNSVPTGFGSISTSIRPQGVYSTDLTQQGVNQERAAAQQTANPRYQEKQFMSPGRSQDAGTMGAALPGIAQAQFGANQAAAMTPLQDMLANQQMLLAGQTAQQGEAAGLQGNLLNQYGQNIYQNNSQLYPMLGMLGQML